MQSKLRLVVLLLLINLATHSTYSEVSAYAAYYFNGSAVDSSTNHFDGTFSGNPAATVDRKTNSSSALSFSSGDSVSLPINFNSTQNLSVSVWLNRSQDLASHVVFNDGPWQGFGIKFGNYNNVDPVVPIVFFGNNSSYDGDFGWHWNKGPVANTNSIALNTWVHVVGTVDAAGNAKEYINGELYSTWQIGAPISFTAGNPTIVSWSANSPFPTTSSEIGKVDDLFIYNSVLSASDVMNLYLIPEPSAVSLLAVGLGGLAMIRRRRRTV